MIFPSALHTLFTVTVLSATILFAKGGAAEPVSPNDFQGTDSERINQAVAAAAQSGQRALIPRRNESAEGPRDLWLLDSAILVQSGTVLELENCHIKLSDQSRDNFIRSANCGMGITDIQPMENIHIRGVGHVLLEGADRPRSTGDSAKVLGDRTYGTDAGKEGESQTGDWRNIGILMAFVENFSIENIHIRDAHSWAISLERCTRGTIRDIDFAAIEFKVIDGERKTMLNQDGLDLRQGCQNITIESITGHSGDDLIALTNIINEQATAGSPDYIMVSTPNNRGNGVDDIRNIIIRNVRGHSAGGHHIVRFLNAGGLKIHDVLLDGLVDTSTGKPAKAAVKIGDANPAWGGVTPLGDTTNLIINNVMSRAQHTVLIAGSLAESVITNVIKRGAAGEPITWASGVEYRRNVIVDNVQTLNAPSPEAGAAS